MTWKARVRHVFLVATLTGACQPTGAPTIRGEIDDVAIRLDQPSAPHAARLELTNVGDRPCDLVPMLSALPAGALPVSNGRVEMSLSGDEAAVAPMEAYIELNGKPVVRGDGGLLTELGWITRIDPGDVVMLDVGLQGTPERADRIVVCNGPGDYEAGRYAVLAFDR